MRMLRYDPDFYSHERVHVSESHPRSNVRPLAPLVVQERTSGVPRVMPRSDALLKCLHRDDPMRHTYLRRRWQAM